MSLFLSKVKKIFKNQYLTKQGDHYVDEYFRFKKDDTPELYKYNCFISTKNFDRTYELFKVTFAYSWTHKWIQKGYSTLKNDSYFKFEININDVKNAYNVYVKNGGKQSQVSWENDWQNILRGKKDSLKFDNIKNIFIELYMSKYKDENRIKDMLEEYAKIYTFKRIKDFDDFKKRRFKIFEDNIKCNNISQGDLGTCYFLEALSVLSNYGELLYQLFPKEVLNNSGYYEICLYHNGEWQKVLVDDYFLIRKDNNGKNAFAFTQPVNDCLYSCFLEKAYAKILGSYADANGGCEHNAFKALTGFDSLVFLNENFGNEIYDFAQRRLEEGNLLSCSTIGHAYSLLSIISQEEQNKEKKYEFKVRNPWGRLKKPEEEKYSNKSQKETGEMYFIKDETKDDFKDYFKGMMTICQTLFGSTVYNFKLKSTTYKLNYFSFEIYKNSKFYIGIYNKDQESIFTKIKAEIKDLNDASKGYQSIEIDRKEKNEILSKIKKFQINNKEYNNEDRYFKYIDLKKSKYILKVEFDKNLNLDNNILKIIIQGNIYRLFRK